MNTHHVSLRQSVEERVGKETLIVAKPFFLSFLTFFLSFQVKLRKSMTPYEQHFTMTHVITLVTFWTAHAHQIFRWCTSTRWDTRPGPIAFLPLAVDTTDRLYDDFIRLIFLYVHREASALTNEHGRSYARMAITLHSARASPSSGPLSDSMTAW